MIKDIVILRDLLHNEHFGVRTNFLLFASQKKNNNKKYSCYLNKSAVTILTPNVPVDMQYMQLQYDIPDTI